MRILPALLLSGLFAGVAVAPAARCVSAQPGRNAEGEAGGEAVRTSGAEDDARGDSDGARGDPAESTRERPGTPARDEPRLAAAPGPAFKGPDERERSGPGDGTGTAERGTSVGRDDSGGTPPPRIAPATPPRVPDRIQRVECRAGRRPLPPPAPSGASRR